MTIRLCVALLAGSLLLVPGAVSAQSAPTIGSLPTLPRLSPRAELMQTVGLAELRVNWASPGARDRDIWGEVVAAGEVWRAGADGATKFTSSHDFTFGGAEVPAGTYSLFIVPTDDTFTFHLNRDTSGRGAYAYNASEDVAVAPSPVVEVPHRERLTYFFEDTSDTSSEFVIEWAGRRAAVTVGVDTPTIARAAIDANLGGMWRPPFTAARYYLDSGQDLDQAAEWMQQSIAITENWWNHWFMARIQAEREEWASARTHAERAMELAGDDATWVNFFQADAEAALASWPR